MLEVEGTTFTSGYLAVVTTLDTLLGWILIVEGEGQYYCDCYCCCYFVCSFIPRYRRFNTILGAVVFDKEVDLLN